MNVQPPQFDPALQQSHGTVQSTTAPATVTAPVEAADAEGTRTQSDRAARSDRYEPGGGRKVTPAERRSDRDTPPVEEPVRLQLVWNGVPEEVMHSLLSWIRRAIAIGAWLLIADWQLSFFSRSGPTGSVLRILDTLIQFGWITIACVVAIVVSTALFSGLEVRSDSSEESGSAPPTDLRREELVA